MMQVLQHLQPNSLVFKLHGHFFAAADSFRSEVRVRRLRYLQLPTSLRASGKPSYCRTSLAKMQRTLRALKQINIGNERLKTEIFNRGLDPDCSDVNVPPLQTASLRQQIFTKLIKQPCTRKKETALLKKIEILKLKLHLLRQEKECLERGINEMKDKVQAGVAETDHSIEDMTEKFHSLCKDKEKLFEWLKTFDEFRSYKDKARSDLVTRQKQLISQLIEIFPINDVNTSLPTIGTDPHYLNF